MGLSSGSNHQQRSSCAGKPIVLLRGRHQRCHVQDRCFWHDFDSKLVKTNHIWFRGLCQACLMHIRGLDMVFEESREIFYEKKILLQLLRVFCCLLDLRVIFFITLRYLRDYKNCNLQTSAIMKFDSTRECRTCFKSSKSLVFSGLIF